jgi:hypothetical protein
MISSCFVKCSSLLHLTRRFLPVSYRPTSVDREIPYLRLFSVSISDGLQKLKVKPSDKDITIPTTEQQKTASGKRLKAVNDTQKKKVYPRKKKPRQYTKHVEEFERIKASSQDRWKEIPGYPAYEVSSSGAVFSKFSGRFLALQTSMYGYHYVYLVKERKHRLVNVHYLVASLFLTRPPELKLHSPSLTSRKPFLLPYSFAKPSRSSSSTTFSLKDAATVTDPEVKEIESKEVEIEEPHLSFFIHHLDGNRRNNHFLNLSILTNMEEILAVKRTSNEEYFCELTGLRYHRKEKKWQIKLDGQIRGYYENYNEAKKEWRKSLKEIFRQRLAEESDRKQLENEKKLPKINKKAISIGSLSFSSSLPNSRLAVKSKNNEVWKEIEGFPDYLISSLGRVYSPRLCKILKAYQHKKKNGYMTIVIRDLQKKRNTFLIDRLVAKAFLPFPSSNSLSPSVYRVHHSDGDITNNDVTNLSWMTRETVASLKKTSIPQRFITNFKSKTKTSSGYSGIHYQKTLKKWQVRITVCKKNYILGHFKDLKDAVRIRKMILQDLLGQKIEMRDDVEDADVMDFNETKNEVVQVGEQPEYRV